MINVEHSSVGALRAFCNELLSAGTILHVDCDEAERIAISAGVFSKKVKPRSSFGGITSRVVLFYGQLEHVMELLKEQIKGVVAYAVPVIAYMSEEA